MKTRFLLICALVFLLAGAAHGQGLPSPTACQQFFSPTGVPLAGGYLYTYQSGTLTPQPTYTDATLTIPNSNPQILNAGGFATSSTGSCGIFLNPALTYGFVLQNASATQQWRVDGITASNVSSLLSQPNTWTSLQSFNGGIYVPGPFLTSLIIAGGINNEYWIDGTVYPKTAAGINTADATIGSNAAVIHVAYPGSYCDTTVNLSNGHTLEFSPGLYNINIAGADSNSTNVTWGVIGTGSNQTTLQSCSSSNKDVITSQHFSAFTGGSNFYGVYHPIIQGLTIDGNKSSETAGFGIRLYGRAIYPSDVLVQNAYQDGVWMEWGGIAGGLSSVNSLNGNGINLESDLNGGNGFTFKGITGALNAIDGLVAYGNGGWGLQTNSNIAVTNINTYQNTSGGCDVQTGGSIAGAYVVCSSATGWGLKLESGAGITDIAGGVFGGGGGSTTAIPFESQSTGGGTITGTFANAGTGIPCLKINGGGSYTLFANFLNCPTALIAFTSEITNSQIYGHGQTTYPLYTGTPSTADTVILDAGTNHYVQMPWGGVPLTNKNGDNHFQYSQAAGCATAASAGATCTTVVTWGIAFSNTSYVPVCSGAGVVSGVPVNGAISAVATGTITFTTVAGTAAAASFGTISCWGVNSAP